MPTPHIEAKEGAYAPTVLMPGDPLRAKFIAEHFLTDAVQVNGIRGMLGYTGKYHGVPVSVQGSGMGCPSMGIYSYELFHFYGVENIMRIGTTGSIQEDLHIGDLVIALGACTNSSYAAQYQLPGTFAPIASFPLVRKAEEIARQRDFCAQIRESNAALPAPPLAFVDTYGCQQNEADSERIRGYLSEMGYAFTQSEEEADVIVLNTCAIREHA